jgi:hypothetical protein
VGEFVAEIHPARHVAAIGQAPNGVVARWL